MNVNPLTDVGIGVIVTVMVGGGVNVNVAVLAGVLVGMGVNVSVGVLVSVGVGVEVSVLVGVGVFVAVGNGPTLMMSCGLFAPSLLDKATAVLLLEVMAKLTSPLLLTSEVTSTFSQVPALKEVGVGAKTVLPKAGAVL